VANGQTAATGELLERLSAATEKAATTKKNGSEWRLATGEWSNGSDGRLATGERQRRANCWSGYQPRQKKQPRRKTAAATTKTISHDGKPKRMG
jgi:hypothetical protein